MCHPCHSIHSFITHKSPVRDRQELQLELQQASQTDRRVTSFLLTDLNHHVVAYGLISLAERYVQLRVPEQNVT